MLILTGMLQSFISPKIKTFKKTTLRKFDLKNRPLQCEFVFCGYYAFASENIFACGPTGTIVAWIMHKQMYCLPIISNGTEIILSLRKIEIYKWYVFSVYVVRD